MIVAGILSYAYNGAGRVTEIAGNVGAFNYAYNTDNGLISGVSYSTNGLTVGYQYDILDRVTGIEWRDGSNNVVRSFAYSFNSVGMITNLAMENGERVQYVYDSLDRLVGEMRLDATNGV